MKRISILSALLVSILGFGALTQPTYATEETTEPTGTFSVKEDEGTDTSVIRFGKNLLVAGNNLVNKSAAKGLLFSFGNQLGLQTKSDYAFVAGNVIDFAAETENDVFIAGNSIKISNEAKIGRDVFVAGYTVNINADIPGDFSAAAQSVTLKDIKISGDVNLDVAEVVFEGDVLITGKLIINDDANIVGLDNAGYAELEKYTNVKDEATATGIIVGKILSITGLFVTFVILMVLFPRLNKKVARELTSTQFAKNLVIGLAVLVFTPIIAAFLFISFFAAPAGLVLLAVYVVTIYLAQGFTGLYVGKLIIEKLLKSKLNGFIEALIGIVVVTLAGLLPGIGWIFSFIFILLGLGLFMQCINPDRHHKKPSLTEPEENPSEPEVTEVIEDDEVEEDSDLQDVEDTVGNDDSEDEAEDAVETNEEEVVEEIDETDGAEEEDDDTDDTDDTEDIDGRDGSDESEEPKSDSDKRDRAQKANTDHRDKSSNHHNKTSASHNHSDSSDEE